LKILKPKKGKILKSNKVRNEITPSPGLSNRESSDSLKKDLLRKTKIQSRLMLSFLALSIIPLVIIGYLASTMSGNAVVNKIESYSSELLKSTVDFVDVQTSKILEINKEIILSDLIQKDLPILNNMSDLDRNQTIRAIERFMLNKFLKDGNVICSIILSDKGQVFKYGSTGVLTPEEWNNLSKMVIEFGGGAKDVRTFSLSKKLEKQNAIIYANNITDALTDQQLGVMITLIDEKYFIDAYRDMQVAQGSHAYIVDDEGNIISSMQPQDIGNITIESVILDKVKDAAANNKSFHFEKKMISAMALQPSGWYLVAEIPHIYLYQESNSIRNVVIIFIIAAFALSLFVAWLITKTITHPIKKLVSVMKKAEEGDLTLRVSDKNKDEVAVLFESFNQMLANINLLVNKVRTSARQVIDGAAEVSDSASQSYAFSQQINSAIQQIAEGSTNQASDTVESVRHMENLSSDIHEVGNLVTDVSDSLNKTKSMSQGIQGHIGLLNEKALETSDITEKVVGDILELNSDMQEIGKITKMITSVSEQTNLLSLNAAIEAARAGEAGRGFAVVAEEVKKLSDQTSDASKAISNLLEKIQSKAQNTANQASGAIRIVNEQTEAVKTANSSFADIFAHMENIITLMLRMSECVDKMMVSKNQASVSMENISSVSEEFAATAQEVSASTEEQISSIEKLSVLAQQINQLAIGLDQMIENFKVD
jgi:methyl-accepting chemotaxis protein